MLLKNAYVYRNSDKTFVKSDIRIADGKIVDMGELSDNGECSVDLDGHAVVSGLVDVHTHGRAGYDFSTVPAEKLSEMARDYAKHGVTTVMPTLASAPFEDMLAAVQRINSHVAGDGEAQLCGVHMEGRYLSPQYKGAHASEYVAELCAEELDNDVFKKCKNLHISAAFERDTDGKFAEMAKSLGATLSLGHTAATFAEARDAEAAGVTAYTHLFNAMPPMHHRDGGAVCAALTGDAFAELICDGFHIAPQVIKLAYGALTSKRAVLITDSMEGTGCPDGGYLLAGSTVTLKDGKAYTDSGAIAGSTLTLDEAVRNLMSFCGITLEEAIPCATENPAREVGIFSECGSVDIGKRADLLVIADTHSFDIQRVMIAGKFI